jgi:hypothetical protein
MNSANFTFKYYKESLKKALEGGYNFIKCEDYKKIQSYEKFIIMRHDVDFSLDNAIILARIEHELGISSSFFIRLHARHYSPLELKYFRIVKEIINLGHEVGLHHEPSFSEVNNLNQEELLIKEIDYFNSLFNIKIKGIATHEPARTGIFVTEKNINKFPIEYEAYFPCFMKYAKYISESGGRWREGDILDWVNKKENKLYILTHPFWWYDQSRLENY